MNEWINFTVNTVPTDEKPLLLMYKDHLWRATVYDDGRVTGVSPSGEIKLETTMLRILDHDRENGDQTKWKRC